MIIHSYTLNTQAKVIGIYGGTSWTRMNNSRFLIDSNQNAGSTGGSNNVTLSTNNLPSHTHDVVFGNSYISDYGGTNTSKYASLVPELANGGASKVNGTFMTCTSTGSGTSFSIQNEYIAVYIWRRTA